MNDVLVFFTNAGFSISSISICICILLAYFLKNREKKLEVRSRFFILDLCFMILMGIVEIIYVLYFSHVGVNGKYAVTLYHLYSMTILFVTFFSWMFVISYRTSMNLDADVKNIAMRKNIYYSLIAFIQLIITVLIFIMPVKIYSNYGIYTFKSLPITIILVYALLSTSLFVFLLYFKNKNITRSDLYPSVVSLVIVCIIIAYRLFIGVDINIETFQFTIFALGVFFTVENQDYKLLAMAKEKQVAAQNATNSQRVFLSSMSHEIRSPMNTIFGLSQLLLKEENLDRDKIKDDIKSIHNASVSLLSLITDITDYSHTVSDKEEVKEEEYVVEDLLIELNKSILNKITNDNVHFEFSIDDGVPKKVNGDSKKISKILFNLLSNVISTTNSGTILLKVSGSNEENSMFKFNYFVTAPGIYLKHENFDFDSTDNLDENNIISEGTLGLLVAKNLTSAINGKIGFSDENDNEQGYFLNISQKIVDSTIISDDKNTESSNNKIGLMDKKILIVDDNEITTKTIKKLLEKYNPIVDTCTTNIEAIKKNENTKYDLILLDSKMTIIDDINIIEKFNNLNLEVPPIVVLVPKATDDEAIKYTDMGFYTCLSKNINTEELNKILNKIFNLSNELDENIDSSDKEGGVSVV